VTGTLTLTGSTVNITSLGNTAGATGISNSSSYSWLIATATGGITGTPTLGTVSGTDFAAYASANNPGAFSLTTSGNNLYLNATSPVPEPGTILGLSVAGMGLAGWVRRRRNAKC